MILMILAPLIGVVGAALFSYGAWLVFPASGFYFCWLIVSVLVMGSIEIFVRAT
ncbi:Uncharacterised protein [Klebsiella michiganensis]|uniref:Uncharacterized protein n=1 Tax=Klebsiella michiganensis TaxID=1134687 RepID=A0A7H4MW64_9ENTR|nr:Uncharacterised protein [Klebsiella michiganensis]